MPLPELSVTMVPLPSIQRVRNEQSADAVLDTAHPDVGGERRVTGSIPRPRRKRVRPVRSGRRVPVVGIIGPGAGHFRAQIGPVQKKLPAGHAHVVDAEAVTVTEPDNVAPSAGEVIETVRRRGIQDHRRKCLVRGAADVAAVSWAVTR